MAAQNKEVDMEQPKLISKTHSTDTVDSDYSDAVSRQLSNTLDSIVFACTSFRHIRHENLNSN